MAFGCVTSPDFDFFFFHYNVTLSTPLMVSFTTFIYLFILNSPSQNNPESALFVALGILRLLSEDIFSNSPALQLIYTVSQFLPKSNPLLIKPTHL